MDDDINDTATSDAVLEGGYFLIRLVLFKMTMMLKEAMMIMMITLMHFLRVLQVQQKFSVLFTSKTDIIH